MSVLSTGLISALLLSVLQVQGRFLYLAKLQMDTIYFPAGTFGFTCNDFKVERVALNPFEDMREDVEKSIKFRLWNLDDDTNNVPTSFQLNAYALSHFTLQYPSGTVTVPPQGFTEITIRVTVNNPQIIEFAPVHHAVIFTASPDGITCSPNKAGAFLTVLV